MTDQRARRHLHRGAAIWLAIALGFGGCGLSVPLRGFPPPVAGRVWIDTDAACWPTLNASDPDDCIAPLLAKRSGLEIVGVSATAGNADSETVWETAVLVVGATAPVLRGLSDGCSTEAQLLAAAIEAGPITIIALGPLTNIASLLACRPDLAASGNVNQIVFVGGRRPGDRLVANAAWPSS